MELEHQKTILSLYRKKKRERFFAFLFGCLLFTSLCVSIFFSFWSYGPFILGTELNTNGQVEYMCLGSGCEDMMELTWNDY